MTTKCPVCKQVSCGDDYHTVTQYAGPEKRSGDRLKVVLLQIFDMLEIDNFQKADIKALLEQLIEEHVEEAEIE